MSISAPIILFAVHFGRFPCITSVAHVRTSKCGAYFQTPFGLAVLPCPVQSKGSPSFAGKYGYVTSQVACHRDRDVPWLFVKLIRIPDEPQCPAYFVTERTLPVTTLNGNCISVRVLQHRIRNYPYFLRTICL